MAIGTTRSAGLAWLTATQTLPNLYAALGGGDRAKQFVDAFVGNINTVIACQSTCPTTNNWICDRIGKQPRYLVNCSNRPRPTSMIRFSGRGRHKRTSASTARLTTSYAPSELVGLRRGGPPAFKVGTLVTMSGRPIGPAGERHAWLEWDQWRLS